MKKTKSSFSVSTNISKNPVIVTVTLPDAGANLTSAELFHHTEFVNFLPNTTDRLDMTIVVDWDLKPQFK